MAELEIEDIVDEPTDVMDEPTDNYSELTEEDYNREVQRREKAEKALVELKKQLKQTKTTEVVWNPKEEVKRILAEEKFYDKNPDAEAYRETIEKYQTKGLSLDEAYLLASKKDKEVENRREIYWEWIVKGSQNSDSVTSVSLDEFDRMTPQAQDEYNKKMINKYWKIKFK